MADDASPAPAAASKTKRPSKPKPPAEPPATPKPPANPVRTVTLVVLAIILVLFVYGLFADRYTPYTDQGTVQAYIVTLAPDVSGRVTSVNVTDNQAVNPGQPLFAIDAERYQIAVETAEAQLANVGQSLGASTAALAAAEAKLASAEVQLVNAKQQSARILEMVRVGFETKANGDQATASLNTALAEVERSKADVEQARQALGPAGADNPQIQQAQASLRKARRDLADTVVHAPAGGAVTNLQLASGRFVSAGQTALTFIDKDAVWVDAEFRENALEHIQVGDAVSLTLDVKPGRVYPGRVESIGWAVSNQDVNAQTGLPDVTNDAGWIRDPQRFVVRVRFDPAHRPKGIRVGSQASLVVYTQKSGVTDAIGRWWIGVVSYLSYLN